MVSDGAFCWDSKTQSYTPEAFLQQICTGNAAAMDPGSPLKGFAFAIDRRQHVATGLGVILQVGFVSGVLRYCPGSYRV